ncbi:MAG: YbhB/YbcL family Raf kinase inhibitor-like protein [Candidatus Vogelbacteria bacterium]|nr:YbhB/YbcL family Raf kinase inhibitor-like protein [Candidatus Vogelbacteria bacterium]
MISLTSSVFNHTGLIPLRYTCDGSDSSPALVIANVPANTRSLALVVDDPDSPTKNFVHWLVWNIKPVDQIIEEGKVPEGAVQGKNSFGKVGYGGPCPQSGAHRYFFKLLALDVSDLNLPIGVSINDFNKAAEGHVLDYAVLIGLYSR